MAVAGQPVPSRQDVRGLRVVEGAMRTAINVLLDRNELAAEEIDQVRIAGASRT
jgi:uncharacterized 2Fe-2S/4Fe-4S cluster protein (DUF4445 family)